MGLRYITKGGGVGWVEGGSTLGLGLGYAALRMRNLTGRKKTTPTLKHLFLLHVVCHSYFRPTEHIWGRLGRSGRRKRGWVWDGSDMGLGRSGWVKHGRGARVGLRCTIGLG